jgi:S-adenosyl methyltransferase
VSSSTGFEGGAEFDTGVASVARVYDYMLGGKDNFAVDRQLGDQLLAAFPEAAWIARENRAFVGRAVQFCVEQGIDQFLDIGSGLPTMENVHEVVRRTIPDAKVVYVDNDPTALAHANALLAKSEGVTAIGGDVREPAEVLEDATSEGQLDVTRPFVVLLAAIMHFVSDGDGAAGIVRTFIDAMPSGSYLILSQAVHDLQPEESARASSMYRNAASQLVTRSKREFAEFFAGLELAEPGLTRSSLWRSGEQPGPDEPNDLYVGVARKP